MRGILTKILSKLASYALKKHKIKVLVIVGSYDTELTRELVYSVLKEKLNVRRNYSNIWWDLSIPLNILGYEDKKRSSFEWIGLILSVILAFLKNKENPHMLVLNADTSNSHTIDYWSNILFPHYLVILNPSTKKELVNNLVIKTAKNDGKVIISQGLVDEFEVLNTLKNNELYTFGESRNNNLVIKNYKENYVVNSDGKDFTFKNTKWLSYNEYITGSLISIAKLENIPLHDAIIAAMKFSAPSKFFTKIKNNLKLDSIDV